MHQLSIALIKQTYKHCTYKEKYSAYSQKVSKVITHYTRISFYCHNYIVFYCHYHILLDTRMYFIMWRISYHQIWLNIFIKTLSSRILFKHCCKECKILFFRISAAFAYLQISTHLKIALKRFVFVYQLLPSRELLYGLHKIFWKFYKEMWLKLKLKLKLC